MTATGGGSNMRHTDDGFRKIVLLAMVTLTVVLVGCAKNDIKLTNQGNKNWQQLEISAGGRVFKIEQLGGGVTESIRFTSRAEDGGKITGTLEGKRYEAKFGYFTPNLPTQEHIILADDGTIEVVDPIQK